MLHAYFSKGCAMPQVGSTVRRVQGNFHRTVMQRLERQGVQQPPRLLIGGGIQNVRNGQDCLLAALLLSAVVHPQRPPQRGAGLPPPEAARHALLHGIHGVHAAQDIQHQPLMPQGQAAQSLHSIANGVVAGCVARPRDCARLLAVGGAATALVAGTGFIAGLAVAPGCEDRPAQPTPASAPLPLEEALLAALSPEARQRVWEIVSACDGDPACTVPEIRDLLADLSPAEQQRLQHLLPPSQDSTHPAGLPGASAAILRLVPGWLDALADLLATRITPEEAAFELDVTAIADATRAARAHGSTVGSPREAINQARLAAIAERFARQGFDVQQRPFTVTSNTLFGYPQASRGNNLLIELNGAGPPQRTLMLVAHGDVAGADDGSSGALDNAGGVAALLALASKLKATGLPPGTRLQLLVTDKEEWGLHGSKAYVEACRAAADCPDLAVNLDVLGIGDGMTLSGSEQHWRYRDGDSAPRGTPVAPVSADEQRMAALLRGAAAEVGLQVYEPTDWTLQSDHIAFQRADVPALGISQVDAADLDTERSLQQVRDVYLQADDAVDWTQYEAYLDGTLDAAEMPEMERAIDASDAAMAAYRTHPLSNRQHLVHNAADQPERIDARRAMTVIEVVERAALAWLAVPVANHAR